MPIGSMKIRRETVEQAKFIEGFRNHMNNVGE